MTQRLALRIGSAAATAAALFALSSPLPAYAQTREPIKIGIVTELSGPWSFFGNACAQGLKIAEKNINAAGGILDRPLQLIVVDNRTNPAEAVAAVRKLDAQDRVVAISGPTNSDNVLAIYGYAEQNKIPFIAATSTPQISKPGTRYTFRIYPADGVGLGVAVAKMIARQKPNAKVALIYSDFSVMRQITAGFKYEAARTGLSTISDVVLPQGTTDVTVQVAQIVAAKPDFVIPIGAGPLDNTITRQIIQFGIKPNQVLHPYGMPTTIEGWGPTSAGSFYGSHWDPKQNDLTPEAKQFIAEFSKEAGRVPGFFEIYCNVIPYIFKRAIEKAGAVDREKVRDAISSINMPDPVSGVPLEFNEQGGRKVSRYIFMELTEVGKGSYSAKQIAIIEWDSKEIPVDRLAP